MRKHEFFFCSAAIVVLKAGVGDGDFRRPASAIFREYNKTAARCAAERGARNVRPQKRRPSGAFFLLSLLYSILSMI